MTELDRTYLGDCLEVMRDMDADSAPHRWAWHYDLMPIVTLQEEPS